MSDNDNKVFTGTVDELLEHCTNNQAKLEYEAKTAEYELEEAFNQLLEEMVDEGLINKEIINGKAFYSNNEDK